MEKRFRHHRDHISEITAEHHAPEYGGDPAEEKHPQHLLKPFLHIRELLHRRKTEDHHQDPVSRVREHQAEQEIVEERHDGRGVDLAFFRQAERLHHTLRRFRETVVAKKHRSLLVIGNRLDLHLAGIFPLQSVFQLLPFTFRHEPVYEKHMSRLQDSSQDSVFLRSHAIIVGRETEGRPSLCQRPDVLLSLPLVLHRIRRLGFQHFGVFRRGSAAGNGRTDESADTESILKSRRAAFIRHSEDTGLVSVRSQDLQAVRFQVRPDCRQGRHQGLLCPSSLQTADEHCRCLCPCTVHGNIQRHPGRQAFQRGFRPHTGGPCFADILPVRKKRADIFQRLLSDLHTLFIFFKGNGFFALQGGQHACFLRRVCFQDLQRLLRVRSSFFKGAAGGSRIHVAEDLIFICVRFYLYPSCSLQFLQNLLAVLLQRADMDFLCMQNCHFISPSSGIFSRLRSVP